MTKLPENVDVSKLSPSDALAWFQSLAEESAPAEGNDLVKAWQKVKLLYPALAERANIGQPILSRVESAGHYTDSTGMLGGSTASSPYTENRGGRAASLVSKLMPTRVAIPNQGNIEALGLPIDCSYEEFRAADRSNAGATPRNSAAIFESLVGLNEQRGLSPEAARHAAQDRYPKLFAESQNARTASAQILGEGDDASRNAHISSANANSREDHIRATLAHQTAAELDGKAGDTERGEMHESMAKYHQRQAKRLEPA
jgi:hypothetical protein